MNKKLFVAGHNGMVGSAICRYNTEYDLITFDKKDLDLMDQKNVDEAIKKSKPDLVIICAAKVGGIYANKTYPAEFLYNNLIIQSNIINSSYQHGVERLLFLGSSCIYPKFAPQPISENDLLTSPLEETNEGYAISKIAGLKMCKYYREQYGITYHSVMPTNLYGINDNIHPENSHVIMGLMNRIYDAKINNLEYVEIWGSGKPKREFLFVDDFAKICFDLLKIQNPPDWINVGSDQEITIFDLANKISKLIGFEGYIKTGNPKMDGTPRKKLNCTLLKSLVSFDETPLDKGLEVSYQYFLEQKNRRNNI
jgi:GDP-L-fucose synthase